MSLQKLLVSPNIPLLCCLRKKPRLFRNESFQRKRFFPVVWKCDGLVLSLEGVKHGLLPGAGLLDKELRLSEKQSFRDLFS